MSAQRRMKGQRGKKNPPGRGPAADNKTEPAIPGGQGAARRKKAARTAADIAAEMPLDIPMEIMMETRTVILTETETETDVAFFPVEAILFPPSEHKGRTSRAKPPSLSELKSRVGLVERRVEAQIQGAPCLYEHPLCICYHLARFQSAHLREDVDATSSVEKAARMVLDARKAAGKGKAKTRPSPDRATAKNASSSAVKTVGAKKSAKGQTASKKAVRSSTAAGKAPGNSDEDWMIDPEVALQKERENHLKDVRHLHRQIQGIKARLEIPARLRAAPAEDLLAEMSVQLNELSRRFLVSDGEREALLLEVERYRNPDYIHPHLRAEAERMAAEFENLQREFRRERKRGDLLESEVHRLTEQIIEGPSPSVRNEQLHELESLRRDYQLLSQKYDMLVSKNIELSNRIESSSHVKSLEQALDRVRERVNAAIHTEGASNEMLLVRIRREVEQLQRARIYLGKALFDLGMLYLRLGRRDDAVAELRAARELGIDDPEANRLLRSH